MHLRGDPCARVRRWRCLREGIDPFDETEAAGALSPKARAAALVAGLTSPRASHTLLDSTVASCGTRKMLLGMEDGAAVEAVLIPMEGGRRNEVRYTTLCVSSQVGCKRGCVFCATGAMGIKRSLSTAEISAQLFESLRAAREHNMPPLTNVVFMGMGEPLDNAKAVSDMLALMVDPFAYALAKNRISVSTVGPSPEAIRGMRSFPARLAWSVHAADDATRRLLVPTTRHPIAELRDAFADVLETRADRGLMVRGPFVAFPALADPQPPRRPATATTPLPRWSARCSTVSTTRSSTPTTSPSSSALCPAVHVSISSLTTRTSASARARRIYGRAEPSPCAPFSGASLHVGTCARCARRAGRTATPRAASSPPATCRSAQQLSRRETIPGAGPTRDADGDADAPLALPLPPTTCF